MEQLFDCECQKGICLITIFSNETTFVKVALHHENDQNYTKTSVCIYFYLQL